MFLLFFLLFLLYYYDMAHIHSGGGVCKISPGQPKCLDHQCSSLLSFVKLYLPPEYSDCKRVCHSL